VPVNPNLGGTGGDYTGGSSGGGSGLGLPAGSSGGGSGGSGGSGGTGAAPSAPPVQSFSSQVYTVTRKTADRSEFGPGITVAPRDLVTVSALSNNTVTAFISIASGPESAKSGPNIPFTPSSFPRNVRVRNLNEIGVYSTVVGEGVTIEHQKAS
jgi:hypothetical protein